MQAAIYTTYGPPEVLQFTEVPKPAPGADEVLIKVHAASVNAADWHLLTADIFMMRFMTGLLRPRKTGLGADVAGEVVEVGPNVQQLRVGDAVFGDILGSGSGAFAEYVVAPASALALKPANLSYEQAAAAPLAGMTALQALRDGAQVRAGQRVLINGAAGGVGTFAVQIAKHFGAEVTAVCSTRNLELARTLGADHVIDYSAEDFTRSGQQYDLILAVNGYHPLSAYKRALAPQGTCLIVGGTARQILTGMFLSRLASGRGGRQLRSFAAHAKHADLLALRELLEAGKVVPVIDRRYPLSETREALRYLGAGHARGKIVITVA